MPEKTVKRRLQDCDAALASDAIVVDTRWLVVNADPRMLIEHGLAALACWPPSSSRQ